MSPDSRCGEVQAGEEAFARLPAAQQRAILEPNKFEAYSGGKIKLHDWSGGAIIRVADE
jgi:hypothetical protein